MADDLLVSAVNPYFQDRADGIIAQILRHTRSSTYPQSSSTTKINTLFRDSLLLDTTSRQLINPSAERLIRWDTRQPRVIFQTGFSPRVTSDNADYPPSSLDLRAHIEKNEPSIFVTATRDYWNANTDLLRWEPRPPAQSDIYRYYEYEIFVHGGLDVNILLGPDHIYADRHIIAFPGGIRPGFIRSAREYCEGRIVHVWWNASFDPKLNPPAHVAPLTSLVPPLPIPGDMKVPATFFLESVKDGNLLGVTYTTYSMEDTDNNALMAGEGTPVRLVEHPRVGLRELSADSAWLVSDCEFEFEPSESACRLQAAARHKVACFLHPRDRTRVFFFCANSFALVDLKRGTPGDGTVAWGPKLICESWPSLVAAEFAYVDAALPTPGRPQEMYVFFQDKYALIDVVAESRECSLMDGPWRLSAEWPCLHQAGFQSVDAVLPNPRNKKEAYFFCGNMYALINFAGGPEGAYLINGPKRISSNWPSLKAAGFKTVDAALPNPKNPSEAYFFSGDKYVVVKVKPGTTSDYLVHGPTLISSEWPCLVEVGFW